jgi:DTW domain-containing protein YfiP
MTRAYCEQCLNPQVTCYCIAINKYTNNTKIIILQYPNEFKHPLATAVMAKLSFQNIEILIDEDFSTNEMINKLCTKTTHLLYPSNNSTLITKSDKNILNIKTLLVLDGTWSKTYKMYQVSKNLHSFPKVAFNATKKSHLYLRKVPKDHYLSTYESIAYAIECIEKKTFKNIESPLKYVQEKINSYILSKGDKNEIIS